MRCRLKTSPPFVRKDLANVCRRTWGEQRVCSPARAASRCIARGGPALTSSFNWEIEMNTRSGGVGIVGVVVIVVVILFLVGVVKI
jgi:hypothetical protein